MDHAWTICRHNVALDYIPMCIVLSCRPAIETCIRVSSILTLPCYIFPRVRCAAGLHIIGSHIEILHSKLRWVLKEMTAMLNQVHTRGHELGATIWSDGRALQPVATSVYCPGVFIVALSVTII